MSAELIYDYKEAADKTLDPVSCDYRGAKKPLIALVFKTSFLTLITLGIYRFWGRTRLRRYYWSAIAPGGDPLEYTGNGMEKFLGFLIAVSILAVYLGFVQLILGFAGMSIFSGTGSDAEFAIQLILTQASFLPIIPLVFYAQYRGRRYMLARTRWRGVRFGVGHGAWGYSWRAMAHWLTTIISLGILLPRQSYWLEKYKTDRTWYGDMKFTQQGRWQELFPAMKLLYIAAFIFFLCISWIAWSVLYSRHEPAVAAIFGAAVAGLLLPVGLVHYRVASYRILTGQKLLGESIRFDATPRTGRVIWVYIVGWLATGLLSAIVVGLVAAMVFVIVLLSGINPDVLSPDSDEAADVFFSFAPVIGVLFYVLLLTMVGIFSHIFIIQPLLRHWVEEFHILDFAQLDQVAQRARDAFVEAEGFADALDVGAAI